MQARLPPPPDLQITLDGRRNATRQLYTRIREAIVGGRLRAGDSLPSSRELATRLGISRNTVVLAYERLAAEGFLESRVGAGTFVSAAVRHRTTEPTTASPLRARAVWDTIPDVPDMSAASPRFDFRPGMPDVAQFPFAAWRARVSMHLRQRAVGTGAHIAPEGLSVLREAIARHVGVARGVRCTPRDVMVTNGSQQALDIITRILLAPGDGVAVEDPGYPLPRRLFQAYGCTVRGVAVDEEGMVVDAIPHGTRLVYVTPSHQYPLGVTMSLARRQALMDWAQQVDGVVVEDDYDSEFRYGARPLEPLQSLDETGRVLYTGSFSKVLLPTLRLGFAVVPQPLHAAFRRARSVTDWHTSVPEQAAAASFINDGLLARHIRRMRRTYSERHNAILQFLHSSFRGTLNPLPCAGGLHLSAMCTTLEGSADLALAERAHAAGVEVMPLSRHYVEREPQAGLMFGYGAIATGNIAEALSLLRACIR